MKPHLWSSLGLTLGLLLCGCEREKILTSGLDTFDAEIQAELSEYTVKDGVEFLEAGGRFHNVGFSDEVAGGDREHLLPLLRQLQDELGLKTYALLEDPAEAEAWIVLVQLPPDEPSRERVRAAIAEADRRFPGVFFETWGRVWLELDMLGPRDAERIGMKGR